MLLREHSAASGRTLTLADLPERVLDSWADLGFDAVWLMGVWSTGRIGREIARSHEGLRTEYLRVLPDVSDEDIAGSPYAVQAYTVARSLGGGKALDGLRRKLERRGLGLVLDFVPNHTARDHRWVRTHPEYYVQGPSGAEGGMPDAFFAADTEVGPRAIAFGKDPHFPGWTDTAQVNHLHPGARSALIGELVKIAGMCDGVRCDMAMLVLEDIFRRTWGAIATPGGVVSAQGEFWQEAIARVRVGHPGFLFIAEAYWNLEWRLQQLGFDFTYDKTLCDRLMREGAAAVVDHLRAADDYQRRSVRFIENHDEERAARRMPSVLWHSAAATVMACVPGMALFHDGQLEGREVRTPVQLTRRPAEAGSTQLSSFYEQLLAIVRGEPFRTGAWRLLPVRPAWGENHTWANLVACWWEKEEQARMVVVNYAPLNGQGYVAPPVESRNCRMCEFRDLLSPAVYTRDRAALVGRGMYFDLPPYGVHIFDLKPGRL
jgi:hypothetical protein